MHDSPTHLSISTQQCRRTTNCTQPISIKSNHPPFNRHHNLLRHKKLHHVGHIAPLLLNHLITDLPERGRTRRPVRVVVFVEPVAQYTARGSEPADLHAFATPALFAVEDAERGPADAACGGGVNGACLTWLELVAGEEEGGKRSNTARTSHARICVGVPCHVGALADAFEMHDW